jgi:hypothetical protein
MMAGAHASTSSRSLLEGSDNGIRSSMAASPSNAAPRRRPRFSGHSRRPKRGANGSSSPMAGRSMSTGQPNRPSQAQPSSAGSAPRERM